jgi:tRNA modification GTPase
MHQPDETIVALATPPGEGALAVLRLSGALAKEALETLVRYGHRSVELRPRHLHHLELFDVAGRTLDEVLAAWLPGPRSYTGEDVVEISSHGGPATVRAILEALHGLGLRPADPGEFTYRAFMNGRLDLTQAEAVADLIHSQGEGARRLALKQLGGTLSRRIAPLRARLVELLRDIEAGLDFAEEDIEFLSRQALDEALDDLRGQLEDLTASASDGLLLREGVSVVLAGSPNVGKSSLFNALLGSERAIVTAEPGTTRDLLRETWQESGLIFHLHDTAGLREARSAAESIGVARGQAALSGAQITIWVCDGSIMPSEEERRRLSGLEGSANLLVLNKADLASFDPERYRGLGSVAEASVPVSALKGQGLDELRRTLFELATGGRSIETLEQEFAVNRRQELRLRRAREAIGLESLAEVEAELVARQLREALSALDELSGHQVGERVLEEIFAGFCIGK